MAGAELYSIRRLQVGKESVAGTAVPATWKIVGDALWTPKQDRYMADYPRGVQVPVTGGGVPLMRGATIQNVGEISYEDLVYPLASGLATPVLSGGGGSPTIWTFTPNLVGSRAISPFTAEYVTGPNGLYAAHSAYCFTTGFDLEWAFNTITKMTWRFEGRRAITAAFTPTAGLTPLTGREVMGASLWKVFIDDSWANLGVTQATGTIRSGKLTVTTGITADYTLDGRSDLDFTQLKYGDDLLATLQLVMELDTVTAGEITDWQNQDAGSATTKNRFIRLSATSPNTLLGGNRSIVIDQSLKYTKEPVYSQQNKIELVTMELGTEYDSVSAKAFLAVINNGVTAFT